jgi:Acetyltransferase (GNAT) family
LGALAKNGFEDDSYAYIACMAVGDEWRRQGVASDLLSAAEKIACKWMQTWVLLHVYIDNTPGCVPASLSFSSYVILPSLFQVVYQPATILPWMSLIESSPECLLAGPSRLP